MIIECFEYIPMPFIIDSTMTFMFHFPNLSIEEDLSFILIFSSFSKLRSPQGACYFVTLLNLFR